MDPLFLPRYLMAPAVLPARREPPVPTGKEGPRASLDGVDKRKNLLPLSGIAPNPVPILTELSRLLLL
jgi:hypothetical protein